MDPVEIIREAGAWAWIVALLAGLVWAIPYLVGETRAAWREWRAER